MALPRILLVDDEPGLRLTTAASLEVDDFQVEVAASGPEALRPLAFPPGLAC